MFSSILTKAFTMTDFAGNDLHLTLRGKMAPGKGFEPPRAKGSLAGLSFGQRVLFNA